MDSANSTGNPIANTPDQHGFVMAGLQTVFLDHLAMFAMQNHMYQAILEVSLPPYAMSAYVADRRANPGQVYILGNSQSDLFTMPQVQTRQVAAFAADVFRGVPQEPNTDTPLIHNVTVTIDRVVYFRHFDYTDAYPPYLAYVLYGAGTEAHLSHRMTKEPDFQQVVDLAELPAWLPPLQLRSPVAIDFPALPYTGKTPCANPLAAPAYEVLYAGQPQRYPVRIGTSFYFDTASLNHTDPCRQ
ncbi:MAG: hypothetical protein ACRDLF_01290 [Solirubrobacteraceae bacterium]